MGLVYVPVLRARQQEIIVLRDYDFGKSIYPFVEIVKEKDRRNNGNSPQDIYLGIFNNINAEKVFVDLPVYLKINNSTNDEVVAFSRGIIENFERRTDFLNQFSALSNKVIPVVSSLVLKTGEIGITEQVTALRKNFPIIAFRSFPNSFEVDLEEINQTIQPDDFFFYDLDFATTTNPLMRRHRRSINNIVCNNKVLMRSAINTDIQNVNLEHGDIITEADNSLLETYTNGGVFNSFSDYTGVKKDDLTSGGTISPGYILYDPYENMYYGYKGNIKSLSEFETTIIPAILESDVIRRLHSDYPEYLNNNPGFEIINNINDGYESGKSQAKFKKIAILYYLHCMKTGIQPDDNIVIPLFEN